jgi:hypothetical protein
MTNISDQFWQPPAPALPQQDLQTEGPPPCSRAAAVGLRSRTNRKSVPSATAAPLNMALPTADVSTKESMAVVAALPEMVLPAADGLQRRRRGGAVPHLAPLNRGRSPHLRLSRLHPLRQ